MIFRYEGFVGHVTYQKTINATRLYRFQWNGLNGQLMFTSEREVEDFCFNPEAIQKTIEEIKESRP